MDEYLDPSLSYVLMLIAAVVVAIGSAYLLADTVTVEMAFAILVLYGFLAGNFAASTHSEPIGVLIFSSIGAAGIAYVLPFGLPINFALFVAGFFLGLNTRRRL